MRASLSQSNHYLIPVLGEKVLLSRCAAFLFYCDSLIELHITDISYRYDNRVSDHSHFCRSRKGLSLFSATQRRRSSSSFASVKREWSETVFPCVSPLLHVNSC